MPRLTRQTDEAPSYDSFLDIVANMVGILIILVMVVGVRVKNTVVTASIFSKAEQEDHQLGKDLAAERALQADVLKTADQLRKLEAETARRGLHRNLLATAVSAMEHDIRSQRERMDDRSRRDFDLAGNLADLQHSLKQLRCDLTRAEHAAAEPTVVESYPTPLSRTVDQREAHFQLRAGRIVYVPLDELLDRLRNEFSRQRHQLRDRRELVDTIGPMAGFRLKYVLRRYDISPETAMELGYGGSIIRLKRASFIPTSGRLGEPVDAALAEESEFYGALSKFRPGRNTVTLWTYPDSFDEFRKVRKQLYRLGYSVAARPLMPGNFITGSPDGSKSAAQ